MSAEIRNKGMRRSDRAKSSAQVPVKTKRKPKKAPDVRHHSGGAWGDEFRRRLRSKTLDRGMTQEQVAERCGLHGRRFTDWFGGRGLPEAEKLKVIAEKLDLSLDWLFGLTNENVPPGQSRTQAQLEDELAKRVSRDLAVRSRRAPWGREAGSFPIDGSAIIADVVRREFDELGKQWKEIERYATLGMSAFERGLQLEIVLAEQDEIFAKLSNSPPEEAPQLEAALAERNEFLDYFVRTAIEQAVSSIGSPFAKLAASGHPAMKGLVRQVERARKGRVPPRYIVRIPRHLP